jgi:hypothetical protein
MNRRRLLHSLGAGVAMTPLLARALPLPPPPGSFNQLTKVELTVRR